MATERRRLKCKAKSRRSGQQCRNWARNGFEVCRMHGVGGTKRVENGTRKDPTTVSIKHGLFVRQARGKLAQRAKGYEQEDAGELFDLKRQAAVLWASLELADEEGRHEDIARIVSALVRVTQVHQRAQVVGAKVVPESQVVGLVTATLGWLQEIVTDRDIPREEIPKQLAMRLMAFAQKLGTNLE